MVKIRLIPNILLQNGRMVKSKQFSSYRDVGNPRTVAKIYDAQRADELIFLDINASSESRSLLLDVVTKVAEECFIPLSVGGGIRTVEEAGTILKRGADKVVINTHAILRPKLVREISDKFGRSTVIVSIDYKRNSGGNNEVFIRGGKQATGLDPVALAKQMEAMGAGEIFLTSIDREGTMSGYDLPTIRLVAESLTIPVIASGGVATVQDLVDGVLIGKASAVSAASIFHFTDQSIFKAHSHMRERGLPVRR